MFTSIAITTVAGRVQPPPPNGRSVVVAVPLAQGTTAATLPAVASLNPAARVRLRFIDASLRSRGSNAWNYTVTFRLAPLNNGVAGNSQTSSLTIFRELDRESFEAVAVLSPLNGNGAQI